MVSKLFKYKYLIFLLVISVFVFIVNYRPETFLIGWDTLLPEFNLIVNIKRSLFGVWLKNRGLGLYDGMSHISGLMHHVYVSVLFLILPLNAVRYVLISLLHFIGGVGAFVLFASLGLGNIPGFIGALFYMFNLGTIQQFITPFEPFAFHFAALPWLMWTGIRFVRMKNKHSLFLFFLLSLLFTPQSFVPTVFVSYLLMLSSLFLFDFILNRTIKNFLILIITTFIVNSFWLLPYIHGLPQNAQVIQKARINEFSSEGVYLRNKNRGDLINVFQLKGFMMDTTEYDPINNKNVNIMAPWQKYVTSPFYSIVYLGLLSVAFFGLIKSLQKKKSIFFLIPLGISFFFLANNVIALEDIHDLLRNLYPIFGEIFRFPFTKFITIFTLVLSFYLAYGIAQLNRFFRKNELVLIGFLVLIVIISVPVLRGSFYSDLIRRKIPQEYFQLFNYFDTKPENKRIALLPTYTYWFWRYTSWGYAGSGFLWYGIHQPLMDRAFDPWNDKNEQFYNEIAHAVKLNDENAFNDVLDKYKISFLILDQYLVNNLVTKPVDYEKLIDFLSSNENLKKDFQSGKLIVYKTQKDYNEKQIINNVLKINKFADFYYSDPTFRNSKDYVIDNHNADIMYPFANLFTEKLQADREFEVERDLTSLTLYPKISPFKELDKKEDYRIVLPNMLDEQLIPMRIVENQGILNAELVYPTLIINGKNLERQIQSINIKTRTKDQIKELLLTESNQRFQLGDVFYLFKSLPNTLQMTYQNRETEFTKIDSAFFTPTFDDFYVSVDSNSSIQIQLPINTTFTEHKNGLQIHNKQKEIAFYSESLPYQTGYLILIKTDWEEGLPLNFYVDSPYTHRIELETKIAKEKNYPNAFILSPNQLFGTGYGFHFKAESVGKIDAKTNVSDFSVYPFPYNFVNNIRLEKVNQLTEKKNYYVVNQSYNPGWKAYFVDSNNWINTYLPFLFGTELENHFLVNNWANGWKISQSQLNQSPPKTGSVGISNADSTDSTDSKLIITVLFWPQYLEFAGFGLLIIAFVFILKLKH